MIINCVAVDDEPLARECIANYVREIDFLQLVGTANNPIAMSQMLDQQRVDLIFLDIKMPIMSGIDFLKTTARPPMVIITTAFPSYALEGYQLDVLDYLLKPITFNRFFQAVNKAKKQFLQTHTSEQKPFAAKEDAFFIKCDNKYEKLYFSDILFVQAMQNYVTIHTTKGKYTTLLYLKNVVENLDEQQFIRVHKSYLVAIDKIETIDDNELIIQDFRIPVSRSYKEEVLQKVVQNRLWRK
ncbi:MAG: LytTR family DNA-binding domain-containing protein [Bacteroidota bacterium]